MTKNDLPRTIGDIARELGCRRDHVAYVVETRHIQPVGRVGIARAYGPDEVAQIKHEYRRIQRDRAAAGVV